MYGPFIHRIDPIFGEFAGFYLWFYGLGYSLGFLSIFFWFRRARRQLRLSIEEVYSVTIYLAIGVLAGGRVVEVVLYEWPYYRRHLWQIPAFWLGGMSTHGVLLGVVISAWLFCRRHRKDLLSIADQLVIPGSYLMGMARIGNFIDGQIVGSITDVWWGVQFPDAQGFRHPVVLYDGAKNFLVLALLLLIRKSKPARGILVAHFIFWYGFLRIFVDLFREYPTSLFGIATGQVFNVFMSVLGAVLFIWFSRQSRAKDTTVSQTNLGSKPLTHARSLWLRRVAFVSLLLFALIIPSDWTQDIPGRYGKRHGGMRYSYLYPRIEGSIQP